MFLFDSLFNTATSPVDPMYFVFAMIWSILLGTILSTVYRYKTLYTKSFVISLALMPAIVHVIIFLVNGNIGTGMAAMGAFSLIRFRSASGGARELVVIFTSMAIGLATGMGYIAFATFFTFAIALGLYAFERFNFASTADNIRQIKIFIDEQIDAEQLIEPVLAQFTDYQHLMSMKGTNDDDVVELKYMVQMKHQVSEQTLLEAIKDVHQYVVVEIKRNTKKVSKL